MSSVWLELREIPVNGTYISVLEPVTEPIVSSKVINICNIDIRNIIIMFDVIYRSHILPMITFQMNADAVAAVFLIIITVFALIASTILIGTIASSLSLRRYECQYFTNFKSQRNRNIQLLKYKLTIIKILFFFADFHLTYCYYTQELYAVQNASST